ncbi:MAG: SAF domain-containing protein [Sporichthyaceae bacterium]|nr:SAF domain-containing protein [Sporichthyaceae bacterium]
MPPGARTHDRLPPRPRRWQPARAAAGVLLMLASAAVSGALVLQANDTVEVLTVVRDIPAGAVIGQEDLAIADLGGTGVSAIPASAAAQVIGQTATTNISRGTLLAAPMLARDPVPADGELAVGLALKSGAMPVDELTAGSTVRVFRVPSGSGNQETTAAAVQDPIMVDQAQVLSVQPDETSGQWLVTLVVDAEYAAELAQGAATNTISLAILPVGS